MDVKGKTKDNGIKCRSDIARYCDRPELELKTVNGKVCSAKAKYTLTIPQQLVVCEWVKLLQFPDGYSSRFTNLVDLGQRKLVGYKSHDAHVFLERLISIAFRGLLPSPIWKAVSELCTFFRDICASTLDIERMMIWRRNIVETLCKMEIYFPPSFFDSMEHLPIHVADEVLLGGPVHYRWMYPFERFIYRLKKSAKNKSAVEASIVNAYIQQEIAFLGTNYLDLEFKTNSRRLQRNEVFSDAQDDQIISIYNYPGRGGAITKQRWLTEQEFGKATHYIFRNTPEFDTYFNAFYDMHGMHQGAYNEADIDATILAMFPEWLKEHIWNANRQNVLPWLYDLASGFDWRVNCFASYTINNYQFHTEEYSEGRSTTNFHVQVKVSDGNIFYGVIEEILQIKCRSNSHIKVVIFKCRWFDPRHVRTFPANGIIEVNSRKLYTKYDPFILSQQAEQVYFTHFPGLPRTNAQGWVGVCRVKPTNTIDINLPDNPFQPDGEESSQPPWVEMVTSFGALDDDVLNEYSDYVTNNISNENLTSSEEVEEPEYCDSEDNSQ